MARILITGSADGLGYLAAKQLTEQGHSVVLHARNDRRREDALKQGPLAEGALTGDLSSIEETIKLAEKVNVLGRFDAVIHNAGVYTAPAKDILSVNTLAPYILTCLIERPERLIYMSSGMHLHGHFDMENIKRNVSRITYSDSKLHVLMLALAVARRWQGVYSNAVNPGWVPTKMGGRGAPDDLKKGYETQVWLSVSDEKEAKVTGRYFHHKKERPCSSEAPNTALQESLLELCHELTGVAFPEG